MTFTTRQRLTAVALCAAVSLAGYLTLPKVVAPLSSAEPSRAGEVFPWVKHVTRKALDRAQENADSLPPAAHFLGYCAALFALYGLALWLVRGRQPFYMQMLVFAAGAAFLLGLLFSPVMLSTDTLSYSLYGRIFSAYGLSPYLGNPAFPRTDPIFVVLHRHYVPSVYGPLWTLLSGALMRIAGSRVGLAITLFRTLACGATLGAAALLWSTLRQHAPERAAQGLVLFLWNPLVLVESGMSGHNDFTMVALLLLGIWLHVRGHKVGAAVAITLSGLVKFVTGALVPLYIWMVLREASTWRERALYLTKSGCATGALVAVSLILGKADSAAPAARFASSAQFYSNNYHELVLSGIRRLLGEDPSSVRVPVTFGSFWVKVTNPDALRAEDSQKSPALAPLAEGEKLMVIAPHLEEDWLRVYAPVTRLKGWVYEPSVDEIDDPENFEDDPVIEHVEETLLDWPKVLRASAIVHAVTWGLFAAFGLLAAWRTDSFERFLVWSAAVMLASYYLIMTQFWPWYVPWVVALGALKPGAAVTRLAVMLSATVLTLYVTLAYEDSYHEWIYADRSIPAVILPLFLFAIYCVFRRLRRPILSEAALSNVSS